MTATLTTNDAIVSNLGKKRRKGDWRLLFGDLFSVLEDALCNTGNPVRHVPCDLCGCNHAVHPRNSGYVAVCQCAEEFCEDIPLSASEAEAWEFSAIEFAKKIAKPLSLIGKVVCLGEGVIDLGKCPRHKDKKRVILCTCNDLQIVTALANLDGINNVGCVLTFCKQEVFSPVVKRLDAALLNSTHIRIDKADGLICNCDEACHLIESSKPLTQEHFDERMSCLSKTHAKTENQTAKSRKPRHKIPVKQATKDFKVSRSTIEAWLRGNRNPPKLFTLDIEIQYSVCLSTYTEERTFNKSVTQGLMTETGRHRGRTTRTSQYIDDADPRSLQSRPGAEDD